MMTAEILTTALQMLDRGETWKETCRLAGIGRGTLWYYSRCGDPGRTNRHNNGGAKRRRARPEVQQGRCVVCNSNGHILRDEGCCVACAARRYMLEHGRAV